MKIAASIIGAGGYTGLELIKLLINHPIFELVSIYGTEYHEELSTLYPSFKKFFQCQFYRPISKVLFKVLRLFF